MSDAIKHPAEHAKATRKVRAMYQALAVVAREQTRKMIAQAERIVETGGDPKDLKPAHEKELKTAAKHAMVAAFKEGRKVGAAKLAAAKRKAPESAQVRELTAPEMVLAAVRELDGDVLKYGEVAAEYEKWADNVIGGTLRKTVNKARDVISDGIREGVPWDDYGWDKALGENTKEGLKTRLGRVFTDYEEWQLERVAITEHTRAVGLGNLYEYSRDEMVVGARWVVEYSGCNLCTPRDGQVFTLEILRSIHPGHPNCHCNLDPVFEWEMKREEVLEVAA